MLRHIVFDKGSPFGFDNGYIRCVKCGDSGWSVDGRPSGLPMNQKKRLRPALAGGDMVLPSHWKRNGDYDASSVDLETWRTVLSENVAQVRHVDNMRLTYLTVYSGISALAGAVSFVAEFDKFLKIVIFLGLATLTVVQQLIHTKLSKAFEHNMDHIRLLLAIAPETARFAEIGLFRQMKGMILWGNWRELRIVWLVPTLFLALTLFWVGAAIRVAFFS